MPSDRRFGTLAQEVAQGANRGGGGRGIARAGKDKDPKAPVRLGDVAKVNGFGVREPNDRRGVKARADHQTLGELLVIRFRGKDRWAVVGRRSRGIAAVPDEIVLGFRSIRALV